MVPTDEKRSEEMLLHLKLRFKWKRIRLILEIRF